MEGEAKGGGESQREERETDEEKRDRGRRRRVEGGERGSGNTTISVPLNQKSMNTSHWDVTGSV